MQKKLPIIAVIVLLFALVFNYYMQLQKQQNIKDYYNELLPNTCTFEAIAENAVKILDDNGNVSGYAGLDQYQGFGGPLLVGMITDMDGIITDIKVLEHRETPMYLIKIENEGYFLQYNKKDIKDGLIFGKDIDGITQATLSTRAIAKSAESISESIRTKALGLPASTTKIPWQVGIAEICIASSIAFCLILVNTPKLRKFRPILLMINIIVIGFWLNRPASIAQISGLFMGYFPAIKTNLIWYMILMIALLPPILKGKNYYCTYICPFGAVQEGINAVAKKTRLTISHKNSFLQKTRNLIVFISLLIAFLFQNPSISGFEPFSALFNFEASGIQTLLVSAVLISAIFFRRMWCIGFCPVGGFLDNISKFRRYIGKKVKSNNSTEDVANITNIAVYQISSCELDNQRKCEINHETQMSKKENLAENIFKLFYATIIFSVVAAIFEKWALI